MLSAASSRRSRSCGPNAPQVSNMRRERSMSQRLQQLSDMERKAVEWILVNSAQPASEWTAPQTISGRFLGMQEMMGDASRITCERPASSWVPRRSSLRRRSRSTFTPWRMPRSIHTLLFLCPGPRVSSLRLALSGSRKFSPAVHMRYFEVPYYQVDTQPPIRLPFTAGLPRCKASVTRATQGSSRIALHYDRGESLGWI